MTLARVTTLAMFGKGRLPGLILASTENGFDHTGQQQVLKPSIAGYKAGATDISQITPPGSTPVGAMWHRTLLTSASCLSTIQGYQQDKMLLILPWFSLTMN